MNMIITNGSKFVVKDDPEWYVRQAWNELFPHSTNPYKDKMREFWDKCRTEESHLREPRPAEGPELTEAEKTFCDMVATSVENYFNTSKPALSEVRAYLAWESISDATGFVSQFTKADDMFDEFIARGQGIHDYIRNKAIQQTTIDPRFAVLKLEWESLKWNVKTLRMPAGNGVDVIYSRDPLPDYPNKDNVMFIPGNQGYYGIVGKGGARD